MRETTREQQIREVFEFWAKTFGKKRAFLDAKRERVILARLRDGATVDDLKLAIKGCRCSRFHMGENDRRKVYNDLELILRDANHLEQFCECAEKADAQEAARPATNGERSAMPDWVRSEIRDKFRIVRA